MIRQLFESRLITLLLCVLYGTIMIPLAPGFATAENLQNVLTAMLPLMIAATGQTVVLITGGIDLSITSTVALTSVAGAALISGDGGPFAGSFWAAPAAVIVMVGLGGAVGLVNGGCVAWLRMPPFIVTLTMMMFLSGLAIWSTQSRSIFNLPHSFLLIGKNLWVATGVTLSIALLVQLMLIRTRLGMGLQAVGSNPLAARVSGVPLAAVIILAYVICGACAGVASVLITGQLESGSPVQWENNLLDVIGATVIGGTSLYGGRGSVLWTFYGVLLLTLIDNSLNLLSCSYFAIMMVKGGVILLAASMDTLRHRMGAR